MGCHVDSNAFWLEHVAPCGSVELPAKPSVMKEQVGALRFSRIVVVVVVGAHLMTSDAGTNATAVRCLSLSLSLPLSLSGLSQHNCTLPPRMS